MDGYLFALNMIMATVAGLLWGWAEHRKVQRAALALRDVEAKMERVQRALLSSRSEPEMVHFDWGPPTQKTPSVPIARVVLLPRGHVRRALWWAFGR